MRSLWTPPDPCHAMPVIAVLNCKGGSGKSTLATNLAAWLARQGEPVMLGDTDRQQSIRAWLGKRSGNQPVITTWVRDVNKVFRAPPGTTHVVLDTPGALYDHELAKILVWVDIVIVPVGPSMFDLDASTRFLDELRRVPRVRSSRCSVVAVGMRWPPELHEHWRSNPLAKEHPLITILEEHPSYPTAGACGMGIFDLPPGVVPTRYLGQWEPLLTWLDLNARRQQVAQRPGVADGVRQVPRQGAKPVPRPMVQEAGTPVPKAVRGTDDETAAPRGWLSRWTKRA